MRTIINFYDRDVTAQDSYAQKARLIESTLVNCEESGARLARAIEKLPKADRRYYTVERVPVQVERINMMSKKPYLEEEDTPGYMSPSRESYWSM